MPQIIAVTNQKGGVGKTTTTICLGMGLAEQGKRVLLVDLDAQGSLGISLGCAYPDKAPVTMAEIMQMMMEDTLGSVDVAGGIFPFAENLDYVLANRRLAVTEKRLGEVQGGEWVLKRILAVLGGSYDYILLDCPPALGMVTLNALFASDHVLVPVQTEYLAAKGLEQLLQTLIRVRKRGNSELKILGILPVMTDLRTRDARRVLELIQNTYGSIGILPCAVPYSVRAKEVSSEGKSIYQTDRRGKAASAYRELTRMVLLKTAGEVIG